MVQRVPTVTGRTSHNTPVVLKERPGVLIFFVGIDKVQGVNLRKGGITMNRPNKSLNSIVIFTVKES